jgi:virulence factor Mce-like protein
MARESARTVIGRRLLGLAYLGVLVGLVSLSIAVYNKDFTNTILITLQTDHTGNQLQTQSDVKEQGIIVGSVRKVKSTGDGATVTLAIAPGRAKIIPKNVSAQILPKTIFGEQYVSLELPANPQPHIQAGDVIGQDRSTGALETEKVLGDILPVLTAVKPAELSATLTAIADALKGRGTELGTTLVTLDKYLKQINPSRADCEQPADAASPLCGLVTDLSQLGKVSDTYNSAAPDILATLNNLQTSAQTVTSHADALNSLLETANSTSSVLTGFLNDNASRLITITSTTNSIYGVLAEYSPSFTCVFHALVKLDDLASSAIVNDQIQLSAQVYVPPPGLGGYTPANKPTYITGFGPTCFGLPNPPIPFKVPPTYRCVNDGAALTSDACSQHPSTSTDDQQQVGTAAENAIVNTIISGSMGTTPDKVPAIATLLAAPALRGAEVALK